MVLNDGIAGQLVSRTTQVLEREIVLAGLVIGPTKAVQIRAVLRLDFQRALDQIDRLVELFTTLGEDVSKIVEGGRVFRFLGKQLPERRLGFRVTLRFGEGGAELEREHGV